MIVLLNRPANKKMSSVKLRSVVLFKVREERDRCAYSHENSTKLHESDRRVYRGEHKIDINSAAKLFTDISLITAE